MPPIAAAPLGRSPLPRNDDSVHRHHDCDVGKSEKRESGHRENQSSENKNADPNATTGATANDHFSGNIRLAAMPKNAQMTATSTHTRSMAEMSERSTLDTALSDTAVHLDSAPSAEVQNVVADLPLLALVVKAVAQALRPAHDVNVPLPHPGLDP